MSLRKSFRKSLRLNRSSHNVGTANIQKKHISLTMGSGSLRNVSLTTTPPEAIAQMSDADFEHFEARPATLHKSLFFPDNAEQEVVNIKTTVEIRTQEPVTSSQKKLVFRSGMMKQKKEAGTIIIGDGLVILQGTSATETIEIQHIQSINLANEKSKTLTLFLKFSGKMINLKFADAEITQSITRELFVQARQTCDILGRQLGKILPLEWSKFLQSDSDVALKSSDDVKASDLPVIAANETDMAEILLRELVDLTAFGRGRSDMEHVGACDRLAKWLQQSNRTGEAQYWQEITRKSKNIRAGKRAKELGDGEYLGKSLNHRKNIVEKIRNPVENVDIMQLRTKSIPTNVESRLQRLELALKSIEQRDEGKTSQEKFESLI